MTGPDKTPLGVVPEQWYLDVTKQLREKRVEAQRFREALQRIADGEAGLTGPHVRIAEEALDGG